MTIKTNESHLHQQVVTYLKLQHKSILFRTDFSAGARMSIGMSVKHKQLQKCRAWPDLFIAKKNTTHNGLFIELKRCVTDVYKKDMTPKTPHVKEQLEVLELLQKEGYKAVICIGFDNAIKVINDYLRA